MTKTSSEICRCEARRNGVDKDSKGQRKLEDFGGGLLRAVEKHRLEQNIIVARTTGNQQQQY